MPLGLGLSHGANTKGCLRGRVQIEQEIIFTTKDLEINQLRNIFCTWFPVILITFSTKPMNYTSSYILKKLEKFAAQFYIKGLYKDRN